jgi:SAM-dependent methyltransferase
MINYSNYFEKTINVKDFDEYRKEIGEYFLAIHFKGKKKWGEGVVLDFGGRIGEKTAFLDNVIVIEHDKGAIKWMKANNIPCSEADSIISDFKAKKVDMIYASHVLEHIPSPLQTVNDFSKILDENGILIIALPSDFPPLRPQVKEVDGGGDEHLFCWNFTEIKNLLHEAGFTVMYTNFNAIPYRVGKRFVSLTKYKLWNIFWLMISTLRWWYNLLTYFIKDKVKLSQAGEIIVYARKSEKPIR